MQLDEIPKGRNGRNGIVIRDKVARNVEIVVLIVERTFSMGAMASTVRESVASFRSIDFTPLDYG